MSGGPSFERIDYQLRYNKHIERKLIFDVLMRARQILDLDNHQYLGFGSMWFADFRLAHRLLGLRTMISMEREQYAARAKFNSPFHTVEVKGGDSSKSLKEIDWAKPVITWLDYDGTLEEDVARDLKFVIDNSTINSVVILTLNAARGSYRPKKEGPRARIDTALGQVEHLLVPGVVPARFEKPKTGSNHPDVKEEAFPEFLAESVLNFMSHITNAGGREVTLPSGEVERLSFIPLFNICHKDGVDMITVGGAIVPLHDVIWREQVAVDIPVSGKNRIPEHMRLDLVPLTLKEKLVLDSCLPEPETQAFIDRAKTNGICLADVELLKYWRHYRHFPVFFESPI
jgi:hypothetical protein